MNNRRLTLEGLESRQLMAYGDWDQTFGTGGVAEFSKSVSVESSAVAVSAVLAPSNKLYLFGDGRTGNGFRPSMVRFNADSTLDTSFGDQGKAFFFVGASFKSVVGQGSKFLAIIDMETGPDKLVRLDEDGSLDRTFGNRGFLPVYPDPFTSGEFPPNGSVIEILPSSSNRFLVRVARDGYSELVRFFADGQIDTSFGGGGRLAVDGFMTATGTDGMIYVAKYASASPTASLKIDRFTGDGVSSPLTTQILVPRLSGEQHALSVTSDISIASTLGGGINWNGNITVRRFSLDGAISNGFGTNGVSTIALNGGGALASFQIHRTPSGQVRIVGGRETGGADSVWSVRLQSNGQPDPSYGANGIRETESDSFLIADSVDLPDGRIAVVGEWDNGESTGVASHYMDAAGSLAPPQFAMLGGEFPNTQTFERTQFGLGQMLTRVDDNYQIQSVDASRGGAEYLRTTGNVIASQPFLTNGVVVLSTEGDPARPFLRKFNAADFARDQGFGGSGSVAVDLSTVSGMMVHGDKIYVWGYATNGGRILRYLPNGLLDTGFGVAGILNLNSSILSNLVFDSRDRMFFVRSNSRPELVAFTIAGVQDAWQPTALPELDSGFAIKIHLSIDKDGNLFAAATPENDIFTSASTVVVQRVLANQTIDPNFGTNGKMVVSDHYIPTTAKYSKAIVATSNGVAILAQKGIEDVSIIAIALNSATNRFELDRSFHADGITSLPLERVIYPQDISRLNDGSFLVSMFTESGRGSQGTVIRFQGPVISPTPLHNVFFPLDVTSTPGQPRSIDPLDVLAVVNHINSNTLAANTFPDVDGDGTVSPLDALVLVNFLNRNSPLGGEAEGEGKKTEELNASVGIADQFFASLWESDAQKKVRVGTKRISP